MVSYQTIAGYARAGHSYRRWYVQARLIVRKLATQTGVDMGRCADVVAIMSPRTSVTRNLRVAREYLVTGRCPGDVMRATRSALRHYETTGEIRGPKTSRFAKALRGDNNVCVVDSHIARAFGFSDDEARLVRVRKPIERRLRVIGRRNGWTLSEVQAAVWAGYYRATYPTGNVPMYKLPDVTGEGVDRGD